MSPTVLAISKDIANISTRSFEQNVAFLAESSVSPVKLARLNRSLDSLYERLYACFNQIDQTTYARIGPQMKLMLDTLGRLYGFLRKSKSSPRISMQIEQLGRNYSALHELDSDVRQFRLTSELSGELASALANASVVMANI